MKLDLIRQPNNRTAFTLVELLVVMAIIGVLVSLVMPALQGAREGARRVQCSNNLRQIGTAISIYETSFRRLPSGFVSESTQDGTGPAHVEYDPITWDAGPGWGWAALILPFLDEVSLAHDLNKNVPLWDPSNRSAVSTEVPIFLCPSVSNSRKPYFVQDKQGDRLTRFGEPIRLGRSHYVANHGQESCWGNCSSAERTIIFEDIYDSQTREVVVRGDTKQVADGPFYRNSQIDYSAITDGLGSTIFIGEHSSKLSDKSWAGIVPGGYTHPRFKTRENGAESAATMVLFHVGPSGGELDITGFPIIHPVNFPTYHVCQMYSEHRGGGNILFGDGAVHFLSENTNLLLAAELASINEGEVSIRAEVIQ
jgi:prepilin-type N-terminal cleavage/methylation domain-containing protein/prepilin-type processing-associated H-X9-DG protein